jgi:hypothetical protein
MNKTCILLVSEIFMYDILIIWDKLQACPKAAGLQSKCLLVATLAPWCVGDRHTRKDLGISFFASASEP